MKIGLGNLFALTKALKKEDIPEGETPFTLVKGFLGEFGQFMAEDTDKPRKLMKFDRSRVAHELQSLQRREVGYLASVKSMFSSAVQTLSGFASRSAAWIPFPTRAVSSTLNRAQGLASELTRLTCLACRQCSSLRPEHLYLLLE